MMTTRFPNTLLRNALEFARPSFVQVAALCVRDGPDGPEILLIKTLTRKHWIIPKGWPMNKKSMAEAAAIEAWEEAGVSGHVADTPIGAFTYTKIKKTGLPVQCRPLVFRLDVETISDDFLEAHKRVRKWARPKEAAQLVHNRELAALLARL